MPERRSTVGARVLALSLLAACSAPRGAQNIEHADAGAAYQAQYRQFEGVPKDSVPVLRAPALNARACRAPASAADGGAAAAGGKTVHAGVPAALAGEALSRGDLLDFRLPEEDTFTGEYVVSRDGFLKLPYLPPVPAQGRSTEAVRADIEAALIDGGFYQVPPVASLLLIDYAPIRVTVSGAVFEPQPLEIGGVPGDQVDSRRQAALGASTEARNLSVALRNAGGIRPDADLSSVRITRGGRTYAVDLGGITRGRAFDDVMLIAGDAVHVPSRGCFQDELMAPSPVSPPGISVYLSNVTVPATGNAASAIGQEVRQYPYGTRFMQAVVNTNCVGGSRATSADRYAALFSRNPVTDVSVVIDRPVEVMRTRADRDDYDPYLLPGDSIACYDSSVTNIRDVLQILGLAGAVAVLAP
ncbi:polysaccharide biosynthesis/export family protein [Poseidonocella sp. HB161398]|uniref:polysaccharide biosynthesis/export family protein n=1 Tax=Poseidonocella sp. HB161398 TaxID=2320855 RepID=UPI001109E695|nr:polysaccharide biosynthesis/export family protein [Poseidonocella sp. HB161398]